MITFRNKIGNILAAADRFFEAPAIYRRSGSNPIYFFVTVGEESESIYTGEVVQGVRTATLSCNTCDLSIDGNSFVPREGDIIEVESHRYRVVEGPSGVCWRFKYGSISDSRIEIYAQLKVSP